MNQCAVTVTLLLGLLGISCSAEVGNDVTEEVSTVQSELITVSVVQQFVPGPAIQGQAVTLFPTVTPPAQIRVRISPAGVHGGTLTNVLTTAARHSALVNNLNSGNTVTVVVTTDAAGKVTDFTSSQ